MLWSLIGANADARNRAKRAGRLWGSVKERLKKSRLSKIW